MHPLHAARARQHITLRKLADMTGIRYRRLTDYEHNRQNIRPEDAETLAEALDVDPDTLHYTGDECVVYGCDNPQDQRDTNRCHRCRTLERGGGAEDVLELVDAEPPDNGDWQKRGTCMTDERLSPEFFYLNRGENVTADVMLACRVRCPVQKECAAYAFSIREGFGIWGGTTEGDRRDAMDAAARARRDAQAEFATDVAGGGNTDTADRYREQAA